MFPPNRAVRYEDKLLKIVSGNTFGRYPIMSDEQTWNMIVSDDFLVPFAGYSRKIKINDQGEGRDIFSSVRLRKMFLVVDDNFYMIDPSFSLTLIGKISTYVGAVYMAENNAGQICISDKLNLYIYSSQTNEFAILKNEDLGFRPGFITFQNGRFISPDINSNQWRLSELNNGLSWPYQAQFVGSLSTKSSRCVACVRFPGRGNLLLVMGENVCEQWTDVGAKLFPYQRSQSTNTDYGCINADSIDSLENMVCWVGVNEKSGPAILYTRGAEIEKISTDGIDFVLSRIKNPANCFGYMVRLQGHVCYVVTFVDAKITYMYDFNTQKFFTLSDENQNAHISKRVAFFEDNYYFVSTRDANVYLLRGDFFAYDYGDGRIKEIPMIRITNTITHPDQSFFGCSYASFPIQQGIFNTEVGDTDKIPRIDMAISRDSGVNYGQFQSKLMYPIGKRQNRLRWTSLGSSNTMTFQFRFHGQYSPFFAGNGMVGIYQ